MLVIASVLLQAHTSIGISEIFLLVVSVIIVLVLYKYFRRARKKNEEKRIINDNAGNDKRHENINYRKVTTDTNENSGTNKTVNYNKGIFINYRKDDSSGYSLALYHELLRWYDRQTIFKDFNNIEPGEDFVESIDNALNSCVILLVIISDRWIQFIKERGVKNNSTDFVRLEIATALSKNIYTIPITINNAIMPTESELPDDLKKLTRRQYLNIDQTRFETDILKLVSAIDKRLEIQRSI
jgi:hypothetical protein